MAGILEKKRDNAIFTRKAHKALLGIVDTEKSSLEGKLRKYYFIVSPRSNKTEIAKAVEEYYGTKVEKVNIQSYGGKRKRFGVTTGKRNDFKKAIVTLTEGESINL